MEKVADNYHLWRRGATYYYHRRVPDDLVAAFGREFVKYSLRTSDKQTAKERRAVADLEWDAKFAAERRKPNRSDAAHVGPADPVYAPMPDAATRAKMEAYELDRLIRAYVADRSAHKINKLDQNPPDDKAERQEIVANLETEIQMLRSLDDPTGGHWVHSAQQALLKQADADERDLPISGAAFDAIVRRALQEINRRTVAALQGDYSRSHFDTLFGPEQASVATLPFGKLADQLLAQRDDEARANGVSLKHRDRLRARVGLVREIVGDETPVSRIDYDLCQAVRATFVRGGAIIGH